MEGEGEAWLFSFGNFPGIGCSTSLVNGGEVRLVLALVRVLQHFYQLFNRMVFLSWSDAVCVSDGVHWKVAKIVPVRGGQSGCWRRTCRACSPPHLPRYETLTFSLSEFSSLFSDSSFLCYTLTFSLSFFFILFIHYYFFFLPRSPLCFS